MIKNKSTIMNMNKLKFFSAALMASAFASHAQDINQAKKAVDAEQFESAKSILKSIIKEKETIIAIRLSLFLFKLFYWNQCFCYLNVFFYKC